MIKDLSGYFSDLVFDEPSHSYQAKGQSKKSVSKWVEDFVVETDWDEKAFHVALKKGTTKEAIQNLWAVNNKEAIDRGHRVHKFGEGDLSNPELPQEKAMCKFWDEHLMIGGRYIVVHRELQMYHFSHELAGTMDLLLYDTYTGSYIIADYKTNNDLFKCFKGQRLLEPFFFLEDHPYNHYQIQLSFYQILLEQTGIHVSERWIIWLKQDETYQLFKTENLTGDLKEYLLCS